MIEEERFRAFVKRSYEAVWAVARHLHARGNLYVCISPLVIRPTFEQRGGYGDICDLSVCLVNGKSKWSRVEVKRREMEFTSQEDFPHPTIFIGKRPDAYAYFILNASMSHSALVRQTTRESWEGPLTIFDKTKGYPGTVYACPKDKAEFLAL